MINRLLIRIKVFQILYNYYLVNGMGIPGAISLLRYALEQSYLLYIYLTGLPLEMKELAEQRLAREEEKFVKNQEVIDILQHVVDNPIVRVLENDEEYLQAWEEARLDNPRVRDFFASVLGKMVDNSKFWLGLNWNNLPEVRKAWRQFYGEEILPSEHLLELLEESNTFRNDGVDVIFTFVTKAYNSIKEEKPYSQHLRPCFASEADEDFGMVLLEQAILNGAEYREIIGKYFKNWDTERVSEVDFIIMQLAVTEAIHFPETSTRVIINEYLNMAHAYSSENSHYFINGILHELFTNLKAEGRILGE